MFGMDSKILEFSTQASPFLSGKQVLNPQKDVSGTHSFNLLVWQSDYTTQFWVGRSDYRIHLWVGQSDCSTKLRVWQSDYSTEFLVGQSDYTWIGFGSMTTVLNFGLGSRTIAVTSWRSESSNISLVVLDNISKPLFLKNQKKEDRQTDKQTDRPTDRQTDRTYLLSLLAGD